MVMAQDAHYVPVDCGLWLMVIFRAINNSWTFVILEENL